MKNDIINKVILACLKRPNINNAEMLELASRYLAIKKKIYVDIDTLRHRAFYMT